MAAADVGDRKVTPAPNTFTLESRDRPVPADELWSAVLEVVRCYEAHGLDTVGPYPSADGLNVRYMVTNEPKTAAADRTCATDLMPLARRFAVEPVPAEVAKMIGLRADVEACLATDGITVPVAPRTDGVTAAEAADAAFQGMAMAESDAVRTCAEQLTP
ncbi:MAG TPA: hypothetical protein VFU19_19535 [Iamia sp.]|nr:hypothetical protein [Iamia sp.]